MKKILFMLFGLLMTITLFGCNNNTQITITEVSFDSSVLSESYHIDEFNIEEYELIVKFSDGSTSRVTITMNMISSSDLEKLSSSGTKTIDIFYQGFKVSVTIVLVSDSQLTILLRSIYQTGLTSGSILDMTYEEWVETIRGAQGLPGTDGKEVTFQVSGGFIQWQYVGGSSWTNLVELMSLVGPAGQDGVDGINGKEVTFRVSEGYIQWQYLGDLSWNNLVALTTLTGLDGANGTDGKEVAFQVSGGYIQWQYAGDSSWTNLVELTSLVGPAGQDGVDGINGKEVTFRVSEGYIQWQYLGDLSWNNLVALSTLTGLDGVDGLTPYIGGNGNWWLGDSDTGIPSQNEYTIDEYNKDLQLRIERIIESVVTIIIYDEFNNEVSHGSGVIYEYDDMSYYRVITNKHVIEGADKIKVLSYDNIIYEAEIYVVHETMDIALLRFETTDIYQYSTPEYVDINPYETVISIGTPISIEFNNTVTMGVISKIGYNLRANQNMIVHSSYTFFGNSGGPLFNAKGQLIGINTAIIQFDGNQVYSLNLAIIINDLLEWIEPFYKITFTNDHELSHGFYNTQKTQFTIFWKKNVPFNRRSLSETQIGLFATNILLQVIEEGDRAENIMDNIFLLIDGIQPNFDKYKQGVLYVNKDFHFEIDWIRVHKFNWIHTVAPNEIEPSVSQFYGETIYLPTTINDSYSVCDILNRKPSELGYFDDAYYSWDIEGENPVLFPYQPISGTDDLIWYIIIPSLSEIYQDEFGVQYLIRDNSATVIGYSGANQIVEINNYIIYNNVEFPVVEIADDAFINNDIIESIILPSNIIRIGNGAFNNANNLVSVTFSENTQLTHIGNSAFNGCVNLYYLNLPNGVNYIGVNFIGNSMIENLFIPESVSYISLGAFYNATNLESINVDENNSHYSSVEGVLFNKEQTQMIFYPTAKYQSTYVIPDNVISISGTVIFNSAIINTIYFNNNLVDFSIDKFIDIKNIIVDDNNLYFSLIDGVLYNKEITQIIMYPTNRTSNEFSVPEGIMIISNISNNVYLKVINVPASVSIIEYMSVSSYNLRAINVDENNKYYSSVDGILYNKDKTILIRYPRAKDGVLYVIPNSVTSISYGAINGVLLLKNVVVPNSVTKIDANAFFPYPWLGSNLTVYIEHSSKPNSWNTYWVYLDATTVYWQNQWTYINGYPTPIE